MWPRPTSHAEMSESSALSVRLRGSTFEYTPSRALPEGTVMPRAPFTPLEDGFAFPNSFANHVVNIQFMQTPDHPTWFWGIGVARATREEEFPRIKARID